MAKILIEVECKWCHLKYMADEKKETCVWCGYPS